MTSLSLPDHDGQENNYKNALNALLQRITGKSMDKGDISYQTIKHGNEYQCTTTMACLDGQQASGEMKPTDKEAEAAAAFQAILALEQDLKAMGYSIDGRVLDVPASVAQAVQTAGIISDGEDVSKALTDAHIKALMHGVLTKALDRQLDKGDISYNFEKAAAPGMFHATLKLVGLPGELGTTTWQGADSPFRRDSQLDCALKALDAILTDPIGVGMDLTGMVRVRTNAEKKSKDKAAKKAKTAASTGPLGLPNMGGKGCKGKGKGKGKKGGKSGGNGWVWMGPGAPDMDMGMADNQMAMAMMQIFQQGFEMGNVATGGGNAFGGGKAGGKGQRKRISEDPVTGDVVMWKEKFGYIQPHFEVSHPHASKNGGKIYVAAKDVEGGTLSEGQSVTFFIYEDGKGLGAEEVTGF